MFATSGEIELWKSISAKGIKLYAQSVAGGVSVSINEALTKY